VHEQGRQGTATQSFGGSLKATADQFSRSTVAANVWANGWLYPTAALHYATVQNCWNAGSQEVYSPPAPTLAHTFAATVDREELIGRRLQATAERLCGGSLTPLLMHLVRARKLSASERQELRSLIDDLEAKTKTQERAPLKERPCRRSCNLA